MMDAQLWNRIETFTFGSDTAEFTFVDRLARENGWSLAYANRVLEEYRRFLYLCASAGHPVTPSDEVDQAWHLHLCYTENYWKELCDEILGFPLHHGPTKGGGVERKKFHRWYEETLRSYRRHFGTGAPGEIWPSPGIRFASREFRRVDTSKHFIVSKRAVALCLAAVTAVLTVAGCGADFSVSANSPVLWLFFGAGILFVVIKCFKHGGGGKNGGGCGGCGGDSGCGGGCGGCGG